MIAKRILVATLSTLMAFSPFTLAQLTNLTPDANNFEREIANLDRMEKFTQELRASLNREAFDFEAILDSSDYEASRIIKFVKQSVAYETYNGVLRGAFGTLLGRAGNAVDQSLLLAKLLRDAGFDARIASAEISKSHANMVLEQLHVPAPEPVPMADSEALLRVLRNYGLINPLTEAQKAAFTDYVAKSPSPQSTREYKTVTETERFVTDQLNQAEISVGSDTGLRGIVAEARNYFWVQYKDSDSDPWTDVHPVFANELLFEQPLSEKTYTSSLPAKLQHRLRFQIFIERKKGDQLEVLPITKAWERPVANLISEPLTFANITDTMMHGDGSTSGLGTVLQDAKMFVPGFGGAMAEGAMFFDLQGNLIDPMAMSVPAAGVFKEIQRGFGGALGDLGAEEQLPSLTAQWLEFTLIAPGGEERRYRRTTFDNIGPAARASGQIPKGWVPATMDSVKTLIQRHTFMVHASAIPRGLPLEFAAQRFLEYRPAVEASLRRQAGLPPQSRIGSGPVNAMPVDWPGHLSLFTYFDMANHIGENHRNYRSGPALVIQSEGLSKTGTFMSALDVVTNPRRAFRNDTTQPTIDSSAMLKAGIWETLFEGRLLSQGDKVLNTMKAFELARNDGVGTIVLSSGQKSTQKKLSADTWAAVGADLASGYAVIIPESEPGPLQSGWWRVNPLTGETLGQFGDGRGADLVDYITIGISSAFFVYGSAQCANAGQGLVSCCMGTNIAFFVAGIALGPLIGGHQGMTVVMSGNLDVLSFAFFAPGAQAACEAAGEPERSDW